MSLVERTSLHLKVREEVEVQAQHLGVLTASIETVSRVEEGVVLESLELQHDVSGLIFRAQNDQVDVVQAGLHEVGQQVELVLPVLLNRAVQRRVVAPGAEHREATS